MKKHSKYSASGSTRWLNCPASVQLSDGIESKSSSYALEGSMVHDLIEKNFYQWLPIYKDQKLHEVDEIDQAIKFYFDFVTTNTTPSSIVSIEKKIHVPFLDEDCFGTCDLIIKEPFGTLVIGDFKYGMNKVSVQDNTQLIYYAIGVLTENGYLDESFEKIKLAIIQPRIDHLDEVEITIDEIKEWVTKFKSAIEESKKENLIPTIGHWCHYCLAKHKCPTQHEIFKDLAIQAFSGEEKGITLSDKKIVQILSNKKRINDFIDYVENIALTRLKNGDKVSGLKLVKGRKTKSWKDNIEQHFTSEQFFDRKLKGVTAVEKIIKKEKIDLDITDLYEENYSEKIGFSDINISNQLGDFDE